MATKNTLKVSRTSFIASLEKTLKNLQSLVAEYEPKLAAYNKAYQDHQKAEEAFHKAQAVSTTFKNFADFVKFAQKHDPKVEFRRTDRGDSRDKTDSHLFYVYVETPKIKDFPKFDQNNPSRDPKYDMCAGGTAKHRIATIQQHLVLLKMSSDTDIVVGTYGDIATWIS